MALSDFYCAAVAGIFQPRIKSQSMKTNSPMKVMKRNPRSAFGKRYGPSSWTLERRIHQAFGVTPKQILDTGRMTRLVRMTHKGWTRRVSDTAAALDYFDQSHMRQNLARLNMDSVSNIVSGGHTIAYPDSAPGALHTPVPEPVPLSHFS